MFLLIAQSVEPQLLKKKTVAKCLRNQYMSYLMDSATNFHAPPNAVVFL